MIWIVTLQSKPYPNSWKRSNSNFIYFRLADILFRFRLKALILILLTIHTLAMISLTVAALTQGLGEEKKCEYMVQSNIQRDHEAMMR